MSSSGEQTRLPSGPAKQAYVDRAVQRDWAYAVTVAWHEKMLAWTVAPAAGSFAGENLGDKLWWDVTGLCRSPKGSFMECPWYSNDRYGSQMYFFRDRDDAERAGIAFLDAARGLEDAAA